MSNISKRRKEGSRAKIKTMGDHKEFLKRISKTLYYGQLPTLPCLSLPVTELSCELWSVAQRGRSLRRLRGDAAAALARSACVSPCALVLAILYLERLKRCNPDYLAHAAPADLFLVSLMVSNKFLQDDGEDDEVICSEWAASGGLDLNQLKKLEIDFLSAIDWNVFVSEKSFEEGLMWLERQVALRQAQLRGFFTYSDLAASCGAASVADLMKAVSCACAAAALGYLASLLALVASALLVSHACLPTPRGAAPLSTPLPTPTPTPTLTHYRLHNNLSNATINQNDKFISSEDLVINNFKCCNEWHKYQDGSEPRKTWYDGVITYDWKFEPWWSRTSVLNWLYQSSLINPMQRWLEKMNQYMDLLKQEGNENTGVNKCSYGASERQCVRQWLNLSKLGVLVASVSDR